MESELIDYQDFHILGDVLLHRKSACDFYAWQMTATELRNTQFPGLITFNGTPVCVPLDGDEKIWLFAVSDTFRVVIR